MLGRQLLHSTLVATAAVLVAGCGMMSPPQSNLVAFSTQMRGANEVPPAGSNASGQVDAMLDRSTNLLRWQFSYTDLSGQPTAGHFHGPAPADANAGVVVPFLGPLTSPMSGRAILTAAQVADLMAGKWYANIHTAEFPGGEIRGQMTVRP